MKGKIEETVEALSSLLPGSTREDIRRLVEEHPEFQIPRKKGRTSLDWLLTCAQMGSSFGQS